MRSISYGQHKAALPCYGFALASAGWLVTTYDGTMGANDVVAGAFSSFHDAANAARDLLNVEIEKIEKQLAEPVVQPGKVEWHPGEQTHCQWLPLIFNKADLST